MDIQRKNKEGLDSLLASVLNRDLGTFELNFDLLINDLCPADCRTFELHLAYIEPIAHSTVIIQWKMFLSYRWQRITISQIPAVYTFWLLYVTQIANSMTCEENACLVEIVKSLTFYDEMVHNLVTLNEPRPSVFAQYVLLWTTGYYNWDEAEQACTQMGMHLASISSQEEYQLVTGMLLGEGYGTASYSEQRITTPCKTQSYLCIIYIGMIIKVTTTFTYCV